MKKTVRLRWAKEEINKQEFCSALLNNDEKISFELNDKYFDSLKDKKFTITADIDKKLHLVFYLNSEKSVFVSQSESVVAFTFKLDFIGDFRKEYKNKKPTLFPKINIKEKALEKFRKIDKNCKIL